jgi:hypothetical protein
MGYYPTNDITWVDRVDGVNYVMAADPNTIVAEVIAIARDLCGTSGTSGGLAQGGASFYARWTAEHNTSGTHKAITATSVSATGTITATSGFIGNVTGSITGNAATSTTSAITNDTSTAALYPVLSNADTGDQVMRTSSSKLTFNASTGNLTSSILTASGAFGCNSKTAQTAYASGGAVSTTNLNDLITQQSGTAGAEMTALSALVANIRAALVANGIMS